MSRRRHRRRSEKARRYAPPPASPRSERELVREATRVERLAYTRSQAAEALGVSRSTFIRQVLPYVETIEMPWGAKLIPVDELERLLAERRRQAHARTTPRRWRGRPRAVSPSVVERIRVERAAGKSLGQIANELNASRVPTPHGGTRWWPSTIRAVLRRSV